ncbi:MAG: hypothetical protein AB1420_13930 [Bacillota bacterium]
MQGKVYIDMGGETHLLEENNIAVINGDELHRINKSRGDNNARLLIFANCTLPTTKSWLRRYSTRKPPYSLPLNTWRLI